LLRAIAAEALMSASTIVLAAMAAVMLALPVPSNDAEVPVTSPARLIVRPVASAVAVAALPVVEPDDGKLHVWNEETLSWVLIPSQT
jgi:hypothetical protein